jgi:acetyl/propionyl-CoA carboxylase alpha subunit
MNESNRVYEQTNQNNQTSLSNLIAALGARNESVNSDLSRAIQEAGLTGIYKNMPTLQKQQMDYNAGRDLIQDKRYDKEYSDRQSQQNLDNLFREQTFDYQKSRDAVNDTNWQKQFNLDLRKQSQAEAQQKIENAYRSRQISLDERDSANRWIQYSAEKDQQSIDNKNKTYQNAIENINNLYSYKNPETGQTTINPSSADAIRRYILSLDLEDNMTDQLLSYYGLPTN